MSPTGPPPSEVPIPPTRTSRRRPALSVRVTLALILAAGLGLGGWARAARRQHAAVLAIQSRGSYKFSYGDGVFLKSDGSPSGSGPWLYRLIGPRWRLGWLEATLGRDFLHTVVGVRLGGDSTFAPPLARADVIPTMLQFPRLRTLDLGTLPGLTDAEAARLASLTSLEEFSCSSGSELTDAGLRSLGRLATLKSLDVRGDFTDDGLAALRGLNRLERLFLQVPSGRRDGRPPTYLTGRGVIALAALPRLKLLGVESGRLDAAGLEALGQLHQLRVLSLTGGSYGDADLRPLAGLTRLLDLSLVDAPIDGSGFEALGAHERLAGVEVKSPRLGDAIIPALMRLPNLQSVTLAGPGLTVEAIERLRAARYLGTMDFPSLKPADRDRLRRPPLN